MTEPNPQWNLPAAVAGWMIPGLGHLLLGQRRRAAILFITISSVWLSGALIGGVSTFDYKDHPLAFIGQALTGPTFIGNIAYNHLHARDPDPMPGANPLFEPSFGRVNEQAILYTAMAGLLNLLAVLDALYCDPVRRRFEFGVGPSDDNSRSDFTGSSASPARPSSPLAPTAPNDHPSHVTPPTQGIA